MLFYWFKHLHSYRDKQVKQTHFHEMNCKEKRREEGEEKEEAKKSHSVAYSWWKNKLAKSIEEGEVKSTVTSTGGKAAAVYFMMTWFELRREGEKD